MPCQYPAYYALEEGFRSYPFYTIVADIFQVGNATTKLKGLKEFIHLRQGEETHEHYLSIFNDYKSLVSSDLASVDYPGYIHMDTLYCLFYLAGLNRDVFGPILDQLLSNNPSGIFDNLADLQAKVQIWKTSRQISVSDANSPFTQGQSLDFNVPFGPPLDAPFPYPPVVYTTYQFPNQKQQSATELKQEIHAFIASVGSQPSDEEYTKSFTRLMSLCDT
jgi:hypothetical protein